MKKGGPERAALLCLGGGGEGERVDKRGKDRPMLSGRGDEIPCCALNFIRGDLK